MSNLRKLDAAIAEARGWKYIEYSRSPLRPPHFKIWFGLQPGKSLREGKDEIPHYSTDGNAMLELLKIAIAEGWLITLAAEDSYYDYYAEIEKWNEELDDLEIIAQNWAAELPEAFARAFYQAKTGRKWEDE